MIKKTMAAFALLTAGLSCAITERAYERDGKLYGVIEGAFRGRWYNHYERGLSFQDGGYCDDAIADFEAAMALRPNDQRRARTYGLHFIDYFPNRERGICLLKNGRIEAAIEALSASLASVDSGRAEYFFNEAQRQKLVKSGVMDRDPPAIDALALPDGLVSQPCLAISARISDPSLVTGVRVNGRPVLLPVAVDAYRLDTEVSLAAGTNVVSIEAWDLFGNLATVERNVVLDEQPPAVAIEGVVETRGVRQLVGSLQDDNGLAAFVAGGKRQPLPAPSAEPIAFRIPLKAATLALRVADRAGNVTELTVDSEQIVAAAAAADSDPPSLHVTELPEIVYTDRIFVDGWASDRSSVQKLLLGNKPLPGTGKPTVYFRRVVPLMVGDNTLVLRAADDRGHASEKQLTVRRIDPPERAMDARLAVAMAPFVATGAERESTAAVEQNLENALVEQERFYVLDRTRIDALVTEWQLVVEDLATGSSELLRLGEALSSDVTMMGTVKESGESVEVYSRLVDTASGAIIIEKDVFHEKKSLRNMRDLLFGLGLKLEAALPRLTGTLTQMRGDSLEVRMENAGLLPIGAHLLLLGEGAAASALPGAKTISGQARIEAIGEHQLSARLLRGDVGINTVVLTK